MISYSVL